MSSAGGSGSHGRHTNGSSRDKHRPGSSKPAPKEHPRDRERRKREEAARAKAKAERDAKPEHRLHRETPFICNIKFRNTLPEVPCDPRLIVEPMDPEKLSEFCLTEMERNQKFEFHFDPDVGIPINMMDMGRYMVPPGPPAELDPKDRFLVEDDGPAAKKKGRVISGPAAVLQSRLANKALDTGLPWLMRTSYISADSSDIPTANRAIRADSQAQGSSPVKKALGPQTIDEQIEVIEQSFKAAKDPPRHPRNAALRPVEILPVLPDFRNWPNNYLVVNFDNDPTADHRRLSKLHPNQRKVLSERGIFKTFSTGEQNFFGYMVPKDVPREDDDGCRDVYVHELEGEYEWVREYHREKKEIDDDRHTYLFHVGEDTVGYLDLNTNIVVKKRGSKTVKGEFTELQPEMRPKSVSLKRKALSQAEEDQRQAKLAALVGHDEDSE